MKRLAGAMVGAAAVALSAVWPVHADPAPPAAHELSRDEAIALVQRRTGAKVAKTDVQVDGARKLYVFRVISPSSKIYVVKIDARDGREVP